MVVGDQRRVLTRKPAFFKILLGDFSRHLRIPPAFTRHISKEASNKAILKGPGGDQWQVNICKGSCNDTYFDAGWKAFVTDHNLHEHDFLVFRYNGRMHFSVRIFDKTACEREDAFRTKNGKECVYDYEARVESDGNEEIMKDFGSSHTQKPKKRSRVQFETGQYKPSPRRVKGKVCHSPDSFSSKFPFFKKLLWKTSVMRPYRMHIPQNFQGYLPKKRKKFILQDPSGKNWEVYILRQRKNYFSRGFPAFSKGNNLKEGDTCIFELLDVSTFRVHVYPVEKDMGQKELSVKRHRTEEINNDIDCCHSQMSKKRSRVQFESGQYEPSAVKFAMKSKQKFHQFTPRKVCHSLDSFSSEFPFFRKCLSNMSVMSHMMYIPKNFYGYLPRKKSKIILRDPSDKKWEVHCIIGNKTYFCRGWAAFCRGNNLKEGDTCIFELLDVSTFQVYVY